MAAKNVRRLNIPTAYLTDAHVENGDVKYASGSRVGLRPGARMRLA